MLLGTKLLMIIEMVLSKSIVDYGDDDTKKLPRKKKTKI